MTRQVGIPRAQPSADGHASLAKQLGINRCPQCGIAHPHITMLVDEQVPQTTISFWLMRCESCRLCFMMKLDAGAPKKLWPEPRAVSIDMPERVRKALIDAQGTLPHPSASIVMSARAVDFMLKEKGLKTGKLGKRIQQAAQQGIITSDMKDWADEVRLESNEERHADDHAPEATKQDAERVLGFAESLAEILFELPARLTRIRGGQKIVQVGSAVNAPKVEVSKAPPPIDPI